MVALAVVLTCMGCTATVVPPAMPEDPVQVFLLSEALHTGIVLPPDPGSSGNPDQYVEFGYGDWSWYALGNNAWFNAFASVLWPTQGTLGRRTFGARDPDSLRRRVVWAKLQPVMVSRASAAKLRRQLQAEFDGLRKQVVVRNQYGFRFVPTQDSYWLWHNCADRAADWLVALGCEVGWWPVRYDLLVENREP